KRDWSSDVCSSDLLPAAGSLAADSEKMALEVSRTTPRRTGRRAPAWPARNDQCGPGRADHRRHAGIHLSECDALVAGEHGEKVRAVEVCGRPDLEGV